MRGWRAATRVAAALLALLCACAPEAGQRATEASGGADERVPRPVVGDDRAPLLTPEDGPAMETLRVALPRLEALIERTRPCASETGRGTRSPGPAPPRHPSQPTQSPHSRRRNGRALRAVRR